MNFVPCLAWVAKGIAKSRPEELILTPEELKSLKDETNHSNSVMEDSNSLDSEASDNENEVDVKSKNSNQDSKESVEDEDDLNAKYNLDSYDSDGEDKPFINISDVATFMDNKEDNYITDYDAVKEDDEEDEEDFVIKESDNLLLVGHIEENTSVLEVHVYNKDEDSFYVHHHIVLPAYPVALEWLDFSSADEEKGNYVAVGDMTSVIKIWDLDVVDILEPDYCLGEEVNENTTDEIQLKYHTDAVISLSWNKQVRNILASGSADSSIIVWDLENRTPLHKLEYHSDKVQSLVWHPLESSFLLSGSCDGIVKVFDCNIADAECKSWSFDGEIEKVAWDVTNPLKFLCTTDQGFIHSVNMKSNTVEHSYKAHADAVTGLCMMPPNILVSASMDGTIKMWDLEKLCYLATKKLKVGSIYCAAFSPDDELTLAVGGNNKSHPLKILDLKETLPSVDGETTKNQSKESSSGQNIRKQHQAETPAENPVQSRDVPSSSSNGCSDQIRPVKKTKRTHTFYE